MTSWASSWILLEAIEGVQHRHHGILQGKVGNDNKAKRARVWLYQMYIKIRQGLINLIQAIRKSAQYYIHGSDLQSMHFHGEPGDCRIQHSVMAFPTKDDSDSEDMVEEEVDAMDPSRGRLRTSAKTKARECLLIEYLAGITVLPASHPGHTRRKLP